MVHSACAKCAHLMFRNYNSNRHQPILVFISSNEYIDLHPLLRALMKVPLGALHWQQFRKENFGKKADVVAQSITTINFDSCTGKGQNLISSPNIAVSTAKSCTFNNSNRLQSVLITAISVQSQSNDFIRLETRFTRCSSILPSWNRCGTSQITTTFHHFTTKIFQNNFCVEMTPKHCELQLLWVFIALDLKVSTGCSHHLHHCIFDPLVDCRRSPQQKPNKKEFEVVGVTSTTESNFLLRLQEKV